MYILYIYMYIYVYICIYTYVFTSIYIGNFDLQQERLQKALGIKAGEVVTPAEALYESRKLMLAHFLGYLYIHHNLIFMITYTHICK
jgi:hypothetical protein